MINFTVSAACFAKFHPVLMLIAIFTDNTYV